MALTAIGAASPLWRRALKALAHAFDPARANSQGDTVFQTSARSPEPPRAARTGAAHAPERQSSQAKETLQ